MKPLRPLALLLFYIKVTQLEIPLYVALLLLYPHY